jgi:hypothetical protein
MAIVYKKQLLRLRLRMTFCHSPSGVLMSNRHTNGLDP